MSTTGREARKVPPEFATALLKIGGTNPFGEPNFKLVWGESHVTRTGFGDMVLFPIPAWILLQWHSAEEHGPPSMWDYEALGEYPRRGMYHPLQPFYERIEKKIVPMELNYRTFEFILSVVAKYGHDDETKRLELMREVKEKREKALENRIADNLQDAVGNLAVDAISFSGQRNKHSYVQQMVHRIEAQMGQSISLKKGLQQLPS